jgi:hypothetical protein
MPRSTCHLYTDLLLNSRRGQTSLISHTPRPTNVDFSIARDRALGGGHLQRVLPSVNSSLSLPAAWFVICKLIFDLMPQKADGIQFQDPHPTLNLTRRMDGFVDYKTMRQNLFKASTLYPREIATRLQTSPQWGERLMHATGGQRKSSYHLLRWDSDSEGNTWLATFTSPSGKAPMIKKYTSHSAPARYTIVRLASARTPLAFTVIMRYGQPTEVSIFSVYATGFNRQELATIQRNPI